MQLTLNTLFGDALIQKAVIDRVVAQGLDVISWQKHLSFEQTQARVFKTYMGVVSGVTAGSIIDKNSKKPLRNREMLGSGTLEVIQMGDKYQLDNDRLDMLQALVNKFNAVPSAEQGNVMNDIIGFIVDDYRQVLLAPHKRMDLLVGQLRSKGKATVSISENANGVALLDM